MLKFRFGDPTAGRPRRGRESGAADLPSKRVRGDDGKVTTIYTVDAHSETLADDMLTLFRRNAARARRATRDAVKKHGVAAE